MPALKRRLDRLEAKKGSAASPDISVIVRQLVKRERGQLKTHPIHATAQTSNGWVRLVRRDDESETEFIARTDLAASEKSSAAR